jgi:hypothetical protein
MSGDVDNDEEEGKDGEGKDEEGNVEGTTPSMTRKSARLEKVGEKRNRKRPRRGES